MKTKMHEPLLALIHQWDLFDASIWATEHESSMMCSERQNFHSFSWMGAVAVVLCILSLVGTSVLYLDRHLYSYLCPIPRLDYAHPTTHRKLRCISMITHAIERKNNLMSKKIYPILLHLHARSFGVLPFGIIHKTTMSTSTTLLLRPGPHDFHRRDGTIPFKGHFQSQLIRIGGQIANI